MVRILKARKFKELDGAQSGAGSKGFRSGEVNRDQTLRSRALLSPRTIKLGRFAQETARPESGGLEAWHCSRSHTSSGAWQGRRLIPRHVTRERLAAKPRQVTPLCVWGPATNHAILPPFRPRQCLRRAGQPCNSSSSNGIWDDVAQDILEPFCWRVCRMLQIPLGRLVARPQGENIEGRA